MGTLKLLEKFPIEESCIKYLESIRWGENPICPYCEKIRKNWTKRPDGRYNCQHYNCYKSFRVTVGTIFFIEQEYLYKNGF